MKRHSTIYIDFDPLNLQVPVTSEEGALAQYFAGDAMRSTAPHMLNAHSSRSHTIFTIHLEIRHSLSANERAMVRGCEQRHLAAAHCWHCSLHRR